MKKSIVIFFILCFLFAHYNLSQAFDWDYLRRMDMIESQIISRGVRDRKVLDAMRKVERHLFVSQELRNRAYDDSPLPIDHGQTISQPYIVAYMTEALQLKGEEKVLEVGTGSGYQAAVLAEIVKDVYTIEIIKPLSDKAQETLLSLGYSNIHFRHGDGYQGWEKEAPFDAIIVTAAPDEVPSKLVEQLKVGGRMIIPVGQNHQNLVVLTKTKDGVLKEKLIPVRFVPMVRK